jgi:hypothetical protein
MKADIRKATIEYPKRQSTSPRAQRNGNEAIEMAVKRMLGKILISLYSPWI